MTEYDFSPEAIERYIHGQQRIRRWVHHTDQTPKADPYQAATPAVDVPKELLPHPRIWDSNPPRSAQSENKKPRKHRTPSEKDFDRERRNDWKYSHRDHMDALRTGVAHHQMSRAKRASYDHIAPSQPLQNSILHPESRYPADHRFSDSQDTSSTSEYVYVKHPNPIRNRSSSVQAPIRVPLPGPLPGPMPFHVPTPFYVRGPEINAQVVIDDESTRKSSRPSSSRQTKPVRSQIVPQRPPPPASAPVYPSQPYQGHNRYYSSSDPFLHRPQQISQQPPRPTLAYPYAPSPLSPPNSAPAYPYPYSPGGFIPEPPKSSERKSEPFIKRMFLNFANQRKAESKGRAASGKEESGSPSQPQTPSRGTWIGSPVKNKLIKPTLKEASETSRSKSSLDYQPRSGSGEATGTGGGEGGVPIGSLNINRDPERAKERGRGRERERDGTREKENRRDERRKEEARGREYKSNERRKETNGREKDWERDRDRSRRRDRSRSESRESRERHKHRRDRDKERDDRYRSRHHRRERTRSLEREPAHGEREGRKDRDRGRDRTPRHTRPREKTARE